MANLFEKEEWINAVQNLKDKAAKFNSLFSSLSSDIYKTSNPELESRRENLLWRGNIIRSTIENLTKGIDYIYSIFNQIFGDDETDNVSGLGIIPLVPVAVILSAIAAITYWINDALKYMSEVDQVTQLQNQGYTPDQARAIVKGNETGFFNTIKSTPFILGATGLGLLLLFRSL